MVGDNYILDKNHRVVKVTLIEWAEWFETTDRSVVKTQLGNTRISTVFLGLDHRYGEGPPLLFETIVFGGRLDGEMERYTTWDEAKVGHKRWVHKVNQSPEISGLVKFIYKILRMARGKD